MSHSLRSLLVALVLLGSAASPALAAPPTAAPKRVPAAPWSKKVGVMLQGFHWHSSSNAATAKDGKGWYEVVDERAPEIGKHFDAIWLPPASRAAVEDLHGPTAQGYLPYDLHDLHSSYGSADKLRVTLTDLKAHGVMPVADIVLNHVSPRALIKNDGRPYRLDAANDHFLNLSVNDIVQESGGSGAADTGARFSLVADVDHTSPGARQAYGKMLRLLQRAGFEGVRYDFAKGFSPKTIEHYNDEARPKFSVAELWEDFHDAGSHRDQLLKYVADTGYKTSAFDFTTKAVLQDAVVKREFWRLRDGRGKAAGLIGVAPEYAVTFVDNHDTGPSPGGNGKGGQKHWEFPGDQVMQGYAYILTHPGIPTVYWPHYFDWQSPNKPTPMKDEIDALLEVRKAAGIEAASPMRIVAADGDKYAAFVSGKHGTIAMKIGPGAWSPPRGERWKLVADGNDYAVWRLLPKTRAKRAASN